MRNRLLSVCAVLLLARASFAEEGPKSLIKNGSFENVVPAAPIADAGYGVWRFGADGRVPSGWSLNRAYPGKLTILDGGAAEGENSVRIEAGRKRVAQIFRPCSAVRPGKWYRFSVRVRDGAASIIAYEYRKGGSVKSHTLASGTAPPGKWTRIVGFYTPTAPDFQSASVALLVPQGKSAVVDDVVVEEVSGAVHGADERSVRIKNKAVEIEISGMGRIMSLVLTATGEDYAEPSAPIPVLTAIRNGVRIPVASLTRKGSILTAKFAEPDIMVRIRVRPRDRYFLFEVTEAKPVKGLESLEFRFPVKSQKVRDSWMPGTFGEAFGITMMGVTPNTRVYLGRYGAAVAPEARWFERHAIKGGRCVLIATGADRFLDAIRRMELDTGLPSPMLHSGAPGKTGTTDWARLSPVLKQSYLFATYFGPNDVDTLIRYAKLGGFGLIMLHRLSWRASAGHEEIARTAFPEGLPDLVKVCRKIRAAGLGVGLHLFGPFVSTNDAYVTPVPDPRLFTLDLAPLHASVDAATTEIKLRATPRLPKRSSPGVYPGDLLRIGDEIVRWREMVPGRPCRLIGCERGALGTNAASHRAGADVRSYVLRTGRILIDPDSSLPEELGKHLARVVNATRADLVYFDAIGAAPEGQQPDQWYYVNRTLLASCAKFDHGVLVQTGMGVGRQQPWHLVPRSASADGHGDLKGYLDQRLPGILQMRRTFTAADIGWYALDVHGRPDELEYVCSKALATDSCISVQAHKPLLESHPRAREVFETIARWERRRLADDVPPEARRRLLVKGRDFKLLEVGGEWSIWEADYQTGRPIPALDGAANSFTLTNGGKEPSHLAIEIRREAVATTLAAHSGARSIQVVDLQDLSRFGDETDPRLLGHAQSGERNISAEGLTLRGVTARLEKVPDAPSGEPGALYLADNTTNGAGWCTTGVRLVKALDLSGSRALGFWVRGDGHGESLSVLLCDADDRRARFQVALDFVGWRFKSFPLRGTIDWKTIEYVLLEINHIAPHAKVSTGISAIRAVPVVHTPEEIRSITLTLGERTVTLPVSIEPNRCLTIDPLGRCTYWPGGMTAGRAVEVEGGPLNLHPGTTLIRVDVDPAEGYAGDLLLRTCSARPLDR